MLGNLCNGDWRKSQCLEVYAPSGVEVDEAEMKETASEVPHVCVHPCRLCHLPEALWLGCDSATDQVAFA